MKVLDIVTGCRPSCPEMDLVQCQLQCDAAPDRYKQPPHQSEHSKLKEIRQDEEEELMEESGRQRDQPLTARGGGAYSSAVGIKIAERGGLVPKKSNII